MSLPRSQGDFYPYLDPVSTAPVRDQQTQEYLPKYPSLLPDDPDVLSSNMVGENFKYASHNGLSTSVEELQAELSSASNTHGMENVSYNGLSALFEELPGEPSFASYIHQTATDHMNVR